MPLRIAALRLGHIGSISPIQTESGQLKLLGISRLPCCPYQEQFMRHIGIPYTEAFMVTSIIFTYSFIFLMYRVWLNLKLEPKARTRATLKLGFWGIYCGRVLLQETCSRSEYRLLWIRIFTNRWAWQWQQLRTRTIWFWLLHCWERSYCTTVAKLTKRRLYLVPSHRLRCIPSAFNWAYCCREQIMVNKFMWNIWRIH